MRNSDRLQVLHRVRRIRLFTFLLPWKVILPTFTFGPSFTTNVMPTAAGGIGLYFGANGGELPPVLGEQVPSDRDFCLLDSVGSY